MRWWRGKKGQQQRWESDRRYVNNFKYTGYRGFKKRPFGSPSRGLLARPHVKRILEWDAVNCPVLSIWITPLRQAAPTKLILPRCSMHSWVSNKKPFPALPQPSRLVDTKRCEWLWQQLVTAGLGVAAQPFGPRQAVVFIIMIIMWFHCRFIFACASVNIFTSPEDDRAKSASVSGVSDILFFFHTWIWHSISPVCGGIGSALVVLRTCIGVVSQSPLQSEWLICDDCNITDVPAFIIRIVWNRCATHWLVLHWFAMHLKEREKEYSQYHTYIVLVVRDDDSSFVAGPAGRSVVQRPSEKRKP